MLARIRAANEKIGRKYIALTFEELSKKVNALDTKKIPQLKAKVLDAETEFQRVATSIGRRLAVENEGRQNTDRTTKYGQLFGLLDEFAIQPRILNASELCCGGPKPSPNRGAATAHCWT
ncbi:unnamed protein product, partial [Mesorhabditis spiculigera]